MNRRQLGRALVRREAKVWREAGWVVDVMWPEARFIAGKIRTGDRDLFNLYDIACAHIDTQAIVGIQVTSKALSSKPPPLFKYGVPPGTVEGYMERPSEDFQEILVRWWKVKNRYRVKRQWWRSARSGGSE